MSTTSDPNDLILAGIAFAARAHRHQLRKDHVTPYASHVFRVCLIVRQVFGFDDPKLLVAALLHDTIEDTPIDCDDIIEWFGEDVARWVAALTKDMRLPHDPREAEYHRVLEAAEWQVKACKLADLYDNLIDSAHLDVAGQRKTVDKVRRALDAIQVGLPAELQPAFEHVKRRLDKMQFGITS